MSEGVIVGGGVCAVPCVIRCAISTCNEYNQAHHPLCILRTPVIECAIRSYHEHT